MDFPQVWREFDDFYVLYTAAAIENGQGQGSGDSSCGLGGRCTIGNRCLILADGGAGAQRGVGQKGIVMANFAVRMDATVPMR
jgi:hypothetical protein